MASVFFRGSRSSPRWFARFRDLAGVWRSKRPLMTSELGGSGGEPAPLMPIGARAAAGAAVVRPAGTEGHYAA
jgi:hypothetical protein